MWWQNKQKSAIPDWVDSLAEFIPGEQFPEEPAATPPATVWERVGRGRAAAAGPAQRETTPILRPPNSNTGGILTTGLDWWQGTFQGRDRHRVYEALTHLLGKAQR